MKPLHVLSILLLSIVACDAGPAERAVLAAMSLSDQPNYSWNSTITDDANTYDIEGKASVRDDWTWMKMPLVKSIARRLGRAADTHVVALFRSSDAFVIQTDHGWQTLAELPKRHPDWRDEDDFWVVPVTATGLAAMPGAAGLAADDEFDPFDPFEPGSSHPADPFAMRSFPRLLVVPVPKETEHNPYSNAQFALTRPHEELAVVVSSCVDFAVEGDTVSGTLSESGAELLLVREGQNHLNPLAAAGVFKLHLKEGLVSKYQLMLEGLLLVDKKHVHVRQTSTTTITDVGTTRLEVPAEARRKLGY